MATKKDLVEAYSFSRRRLVTAFVSGAPGGREVEPARPGRSVVGGLALSVLLVAGAAIAGIFTGRPEIDWSEPGMFLSKERGAMYVVVPGSGGDELRPVINVTSAQLILGAEVSPEIVAQDEIDEQHIGEDIGILGAPADIPSTDSLVPSGWTACTADRRGITVNVGDDSLTTPAPDAGFTVNVGDDTYLVAQSRGTALAETGAHAYELPHDQVVRDRVLSSLGLPNTTQGMEVPEDAVGLLPQGTPLSLAAFGVGRVGEPFEGEGLPAGAEVGDWFTYAGRGYVITGGDEGGAGPAPLSAFEYTLYQALAQDTAKELTVTELSVGQGSIELDDTRWPDQELVAATDELCLRMIAADGEAPRVLLATAPEESASAVESTDSPEDVEPSVEEGLGAYVRSATWGVATGGSPFLITSKPTRHELVGPEVATNLGYDEVEAPVVPNSWVELFDQGVPLSLEAALCPPSAETDTGSDCT